MYGVSGQTPNKTAPMFALSFPRWFCKYCHIPKPVGLWKSTSGRPNSYALENSCGIRGRATLKGYCHRMTYWLRPLHSGSKELCLHTAWKLEHGLCSQTLNSTSAGLLSASASSSVKHETIAGLIFTRF